MMTVNSICRRTVRTGISLAWIGVIFCVILAPAPAQAQASRPFSNSIEIRDDNKRKTFYWNSKPIFSYNYAVINPPNNLEEIYQRSGYLHPIHAPSGQIVTDDFSDDHAHQHGVFFAFVKAKINDKTVDFWNQHRRTGSVEHFKFVKQTNTAPSNLPSGNPKLKAMLRHFAWEKKPGAGQAGAPGSKRYIFEETWLMSAKARPGMFIIDWASELKNVTENPVELLKNHYGPLGVRGAAAWRNPQKSEFNFLTASGKKRNNGNLSRERWAAMSGLIDSKRCGIAVIGGKNNFRSPQPVRIHPTMPYFSFAPVAEKSLILGPGESFHSQFQIIAFEGQIPVEILNQLPPQ